MPSVCFTRPFPDLWRSSSEQVLWLALALVVEHSPVLPRPLPSLPVFHGDEDSVLCLVFPPATPVWFYALSHSLRADCIADFYLVVSAVLCLLPLLG